MICLSRTIASGITPTFVLHVKLNHPWYLCRINIQGYLPDRKRLTSLPDKLATSRGTGKPPPSKPYMLPVTHTAVAEAEGT